MYPYKEWLAKKEYRHTFYSEWDAIRWQRYLLKHGVDAGVFCAYKWDEQATTWTVAPAKA